MAVIVNARTETLMPILQKRVQPDSIVYTDSLSSYNALDVSQFHHLRIHHAKLFADRKITSTDRELLEPGQATSAPLQLASNQTASTGSSRSASGTSTGKYTNSF